MPIDSKIFNSPAANGDVAGVALTASIALNKVAYALEAVAAGRPADKEIAQIKESAEDLSKMFDRLTGWQS